MHSAGQTLVVGMANRLHQAGSLTLAALSAHSRTFVCYLTHVYSRGQAHHRRDLLPR